MKIRSNPPWSNDALTSHWEQILAAVGPTFMPKHTKARTKIKAEEFGTGHYGVVMPTMAPGIVMKLTSDPTEVKFVKWVLRNKSFAENHNGLIPYLKLVELAGTTKSGRGVVAIWRAEAEHVGKVFPFANLDWDVGFGVKASSGSSNDPVLKNFNDYDRRCALETRERLEQFQDVARPIFPSLKKSKFSGSDAFAEMSEHRGDVDIDHPTSIPSHLKGVRRVGWMLESTRLTAEMMANEPFGTEIGQVLLDLLEDHGILLADVHRGNIGMFKPNDYDRPIPVITDPGHAVFLLEEKS